MRVKSKFTRICTYGALSAIVFVATCMFRSTLSHLEWKLGWLGSVTAAYTLASIYCGGLSVGKVIAMMFAVVAMLLAFLVYATISVPKWPVVG